MRSKLLGTAAGLALAACAVVASAGSASAQGWGWHRGWGFGWPVAAAAGIAGGTIAAATAPLWAPGYYDEVPGRRYGPYDYGLYDYDTYNYVPGPAVTVAPGPVMAQGGNVSWCEAHYRSYNPATGMFLGFDGLRHSCP